MRRTGRSSSLPALSLLLCAGLAYGQAGGIQGVVRDESGAFIPGAALRVTNVLTGVVSQGSANEAGLYSIPFLPPGTYQVEASATGFSAAVRSNLKLDVGQLARVDFELRVGGVVETVEVSAAAPLLESESTMVGQVIDNKRIVEMPLNGRNYLQLAQLAPGVLPASRSRARSEFEFIAMGQRSLQTNVLLDGVDNSSRSSGGALGLETQAAKPSIDAVGEFKVVTNNFSAEYGYKMGPKVIVSLKSGTNNLHGSLFEFVRNEDFDANGFFANRSGATKAAYRRNQFGGTVGGPIVKDRTFYFFSYEGTRIRTGRTSLTTVPSAAARGGDFSQERLNINQIFDPLTTVGTGAAAVRQPFAGNVIPRTRFDPVSAPLAALYPSFNVAGREFAANNYFRAATTSDDTNQFDVKGDHNFSASDRVFGRYSGRRLLLIEPGTMPMEAGNGTARRLDLSAGNIAAGWTHSFAPAVFSELRFGYTWFPTLNGLLATEPLNAKYGIKNAPGDTFNDGLNQDFSSLAPAHYNGLGTGCCLPQVNDLKNQHISGNLWMQKGAHTVKLGLEQRSSEVFRSASRLRRGTFGFSGVYTTQNPNVAASRSSTGNSLADLLLGWSNRTQVGNLNGETVVTPYWGLYVQDDWKITPRLTLNAGLRWDFMMLAHYPDGMTNGFGGVSNYVTEWTVDPSDPAMNTFARPKSPKDRGGRSDRNNFGPRLGLAYQLTRKTVVRTGGALIYGEADSGNVTGSVWQALPPIFTEITKDGTTTTPAVFVRNGFDPVQLPAKEPLPGVRVDTRPLKWPTTYSGQWFLDIQRELPWDMLVTAGYQGSSTSQLAMYNDVNNPGPHPVIPAAQRLLRPRFSAVWHFWNGGNANYNALNLRAEKRFSKGLTFLNAYTWSHNIDTQPQRSDDEDRQMANMYNLSAERSHSGIDIRHSFTSSVTYEMPLGRGRAVGAGWPRALDAALGGWQVGGILVLRTGFPFDVNFPGDAQNSATRNRGNRIGSGVLPNPTIDKWFDETAFVPSAPGVYGNTGRYLLFGPGTRQFDFSLAKRFDAPWEGHYVQFRFESFNFTNTPQFGQPVGTLRSANTATINSASEPRRIQLGLKYVF